MSFKTEKLIIEAKNGNIEAFETLVADYEKIIFNMALKVLDNREEASELAQEILVEAYKSIWYLNENTSFSIWLLKLAAEICSKVGKMPSARLKSVCSSGLFINAVEDSSDPAFCRNI